MNDSISLHEIITELTVVDYTVICLSPMIGLICLAGIIFAFIRCKQHKFLSIITIIFFLLMAANFVIVPNARIFTGYYLEKSIFHDDTKKNEIIKTKGKLTDEDKRLIFSDKATELIMSQRSISSIISAIELLIQIVLVILILIAIFHGRGKINPPLSSVQKE